MIDTQEADCSAKSVTVGIQGGIVSSKLPPDCLIITTKVINQQKGQDFHPNFLSDQKLDKLDWRLLMKVTTRDCKL